MANSILRLPEVKAKTKKSRSSGWLESEIDNWINERIAERDSEVA